MTCFDFEKALYLGRICASFAGTAAEHHIDPVLSFSIPRSMNQELLIIPQQPPLLAFDRLTLTLTHGHREEAQPNRIL